MTQNQVKVLKSKAAQLRNFTGDLQNVLKVTSHSLSILLRPE
jgi:hypothetical protein